MSLIHPIFLGALLAVGIPILIHLTQRRKFEELKVGTLRFLRLAEKKRRLRLRVEQWPLLLLRLLAVVLLALLFSRPFFADRDRLSSGGHNTLVLLDASGSMTDDMKSEALKQARKAIGRGESVTLAQFSDAVTPLANLDDYAPIPGAPTDFDNALGWALDHLRNEGLDSARVVLVGHFAAAQMPAVPPRVWPPGIAVELIAIEPPDRENQAVRGLELLTPFKTAEMEIEARVTPLDRERVISLSAEGINLKKKLPARAERVIFSFRPPRDEVRGSISIDGGDPWPADDQRPFAARWVDPEPVMIVDGFPGSTPFEGQGYFLRKALLASGAAHGLSPFRPDIAFGINVDNSTIGNQRFVAPNRAIPVDGKAKEEKDISSYQAFALCGPTTITQPEANRLRDAVKAGAGLLIVLDGRWSAEVENVLRSADLLPQRVAFTNGLQFRRLQSWDQTHPALAMFDGKERGDLRPLAWRDAFAIEPGPDWKVLATLENGSPLLLEKKNADPAQGRLMLLAHPLTREWTDLPREPMFVPFVKNLFGTLTRYQARQHSATTLTPGSREMRPIGVYQTSGDTFEAVAADPTESRVTPTDAASFRKAFAIPDPGTVAATTPFAITGHEDRPRDGELWRWIALGLLLLLIFECALATRRSNQPSPLDA